MPTSEKPKQPESDGPAQEMFYEDEDGKRQDAELHNAILADGNTDAATAVGIKTALHLGLKPEAVQRLMRKD